MNSKNDSSVELRMIKKALAFPLLFIGVAWIVKLYEFVFSFDAGTYGVYPLSVEGLKGILFMPFIHNDLEHIYANSGAFLLLASTLFYYYRPVAYRSFFIIYLLSGLITWFIGRSSHHIGASGVVYGLAAFLVTVGLLNRNKGSAAIALVVIFLYGGMVWGVLPTTGNISWEGHLAGFIAGFFAAVYFASDLKPKPELPVFKDFGNYSTTEPINFEYNYKPTDEND